MNITSVNAGGFANGLSCFCPNCARFFSAQFLDSGDNLLFNVFSDAGMVFCPHCGCDELISSSEELTDYLVDHDIDPVNFYHAFPPDEPIPQSRTGATPKQVEWIVGCVISDKQKKIPVSIESLAAQLGYDEEIVRNVFYELHITETTEAAA